MKQDNKTKDIYSVYAKPRREKIQLSLIAALSLAFNFGLFNPIDFYLNNQTDLGIPYKLVLLACIPVAAAIFAVCFSVLALTGKKAHIISLSVITGLNLALYIQGNYMTQGMQLLDGKAYYVHPLRAILDILLWIVILALPFVIYKKKRESFKLFATVIAGSILIIEIVAIVYTGIVKMFDKTIELKNIVSGDKLYKYNIEKEFTYSSDRNLIIVIPDEYDSFCFDSAVSEVPESVSGFKGFTYYNNTVGMYKYTAEAVTNLFTGKQVDSKDEIPAAYTEDCFFEHIPEEYNVEFYTDSICFPNEVKFKYADNCEVNDISVKDVFNAGITLYDMALYRTVPDAVKGPFWRYSGDLLNMLASGKTYMPENLAFLHSIPSKFELTDKPCLKVIYLHGLHDLRTLNRDLERVSDSDVEPQETAIAVNKILSAYLEALQQNGIYDNSDIIVLGDHGHRENHEGRYPLLLVKRAGETGTGIKVSSAPISYADIFPTLCYLADNNSKEGRTIFDIKEGEKRERYFAALDETITDDVDRSQPLVVSKGLMGTRTVGPVNQPFT